jgi:hypothetical protein
MRSWSFSKPKTPGFGIRKDFYLTVLSSKPVMPAMLTIINPKGQGGAVEGFGAPLANVPKEALGQPLERGAYVIASKDQKTVIKLLVLSKEEAGFDPEPFTRSSLAAEMEPELLNRIRATWTVGQMTFESHDPAVYPSIDFLLDFVSRFAELTDGVVADPISRRYLLPEAVKQVVRADPKVDAREVVGLSHRAHPTGLHLFTLGMQKFGLPEFEMIGLEITDLRLAESLLLSLCQSALLGVIPHNGDKVGAKGLEFEIRDGGFDRGLWEGIAVFEVIPPTLHSVSECLAGWKAQIEGRL